MFRLLISYSSHLFHMAVVWFSNFVRTVFIYIYSCITSIIPSRNYILLFKRAGQIFLMYLVSLLQFVIPWLLIYSLIFIVSMILNVCLFWLFLPSKPIIQLPIQFIYDTKPFYIIDPTNIYDTYVEEYLSTISYLSKTTNNNISPMAYIPIHQDKIDSLSSLLEKNTYYDIALSILAYDVRQSFDKSYHSKNHNHHHYPYDYASSTFDSIGYPSASFDKLSTFDKINNIHIYIQSSLPQHESISSISEANDKYYYHPNLLTISTFMIGISTRYPYMHSQGMKNITSLFTILQRNSYTWFINYPSSPTSISLIWCILYQIYSIVILPLQLLYVLLYQLFFRWIFWAISSNNSITMVSESTEYTSITHKYICLKDYYEPMSDYQSYGILIQLSYNPLVIITKGILEIKQQLSWIQYILYHYYYTSLFIGSNIVTIVILMVWFILKSLSNMKKTSSLSLLNIQNSNYETLDTRNYSNDESNIEETELIQDLTNYPLQDTIRLPEQTITTSTSTNRLLHYVRYPKLLHSTSTTIPESSVSNISLSNTLPLSSSLMSTNSSGLTALI